MATSGYAESTLKLEKELEILKDAIDSFDATNTMTYQHEPDEIISQAAELASLLEDIEISAKKVNRIEEGLSIYKDYKKRKRPVSEEEED